MEALISVQSVHSCVAYARLLQTVTILQLHTEWNYIVLNMSSDNDFVMLYDPKQEMESSRDLDYTI